MNLIAHQGAIGTAARTTLNGREYLVAPMVAIVSGVLNGELVTTEEIGKFPEAWNGIPVPLGHPTVRGVFVSANSPEIVENQCVGRFWNARMDGEKLVGELWLDVAKAEALGGDAVLALKRVEAGEPIEVSTAYFRDFDATPGIEAGKAYAGIARNLRPDHVALLLHQVGACSWKDGCGCPRVNMSAEMSVLKINYEISLDEARNKVYEAWLAVFDPERRGDVWVREVFADHVIVHGPDGLMSYPYQRGSDGIAFGVPVKVRVVYEPVTNRQSVVYSALCGLQRALGFQTLAEEVEMSDTKVDGDEVSPQAAASLYGSCSEKAADVGSSQVNVESQGVVAAAQELAGLVRDFGGVKAVRSAIEAVMANNSQQKAGLIAEIRANEKSMFSEDELNALPLVILEKLANSLRPANYFGRGTVRINADEPPVPPAVVMAEK